MIKAAIFDLDGTLIDSEPLWKEAEIHVFKTLGVELDTQKCRNTTGLSILQVVRYWHRVFQWKSDKTYDEIVDAILQKLIELVKEKGKLKEGVPEVIEFLKERNLPKVVASSSPKFYIKELVNHFGLHVHFKKVFSSLDEAYPKPHPAVFMKAADYLGVECQECIGFEDSFYGLLAVKAAQMNAVAVLEPEDYIQSRYDFADVKLQSLKSFGTSELEALNKPF